MKVHLNDKVEGLIKIQKILVTVCCHKEWWVTVCTHFCC